jgi:ribosomal protein L31E
LREKYSKISRAKRAKRSIASIKKLSGQLIGYLFEINLFLSVNQIFSESLF